MIAQSPLKVASASNRDVIEGMVSAFSQQDIDKVMDLFSEEAVYYDVHGGSVSGKRYRGRGVRLFNQRLFHRLPPHSYEDVIILVDGDQAHASWTLVIELPMVGKTLKIRGCDYFELQQGKVTLKSAWLKSKA